MQKQRYKQRNFYTRQLTQSLTELYSYDTLVGYRYNNYVLFTTKKYSPTTSKQCTQYTNENYLTRYNISQNWIDTLSNCLTVHQQLDLIKLTLKQQGAN